MLAIAVVKHLDFVVYKQVLHIETLSSVQYSHNLVQSVSWISHLSSDFFGIVLYKYKWLCA